MNNIAKENYRMKKSVVLGVIIFIFAVISFFLYKSDYRLTGDLRFGKMGTVTIDIPFANTHIYIDESKKIETTKENEVVNLSFSPTNHSIIVFREGYFPWKKDFSVPKGGIIKLQPFFISQNATGEIITNLDPEYWNIRNKILKNQTPTREQPKISPNGAKLWLDDNAIMFELGSTTTKVVQPDTIIKNVDYYKNRSDVFIFSTSNSVYVIEKDKEGGQNVMPVYRGQNPNFIVNDLNTIYIFDANNLMIVLI